MESEIRKVLKEVHLDFLDINYVRETDEFSIDFENNALPLLKIYIGVKANHTMREIMDNLGKKHEDVLLFYLHCKNFLLELVAHIKRQFEDC